MMRLAEYIVVVPKDKNLKTNFVFTETQAAPELN